MNVRPSNYLAALALGALGLSGLATGCELIASVDRSKIPETSAGIGGAGGTSSATGGSGGTSTSGTGGTGGTGTGGHAGQGGTGGTGGATCDPKCGSPAEPDCESIKCVDGKCESTFQADGTKLPDAKQTAGDCKAKVCDGAGKAVEQIDDEDRATDSNDCMNHTCDQGTPKSAPVGKGTTCMANGGAVCDGAGQCVECNDGADCKDGGKPVCKESKCVPATCDDKIKNGTETDKDCGGSCTACDTGFACAVAGDCKSKNCKNNLCAAPACDDGIQNGAETETDCGGGCKGCGPTQKCAVDTDCLGKQCDANNKTCTPNCLDTVKNGNETDVDCGGDACGKCANTKLCSVPGDCTSNGCCAGTCSNCCNGVKDGNETDLDCGGSCDAKCNDYKSCTGNADCLSGLCQNFQCKPGTCSNGAKDGDESDVDCGGSCQPCVAGKACGKVADCASSFCADGVCCNAKCDGICEACTKAKTGLADGACNAVPNGADPDNECAQDAASTCKQNGFCNGQRACAKYDAATECVAASCTSGTQTNSSKCDGKGACPAATTQSCGQYICGANACKTACTADADCISGDFCENPGANGVCKAKLAVGSACSGNNQCTGNACVDGFCCNTPCSGECQACSAAKTGGSNGTCAPVQAGQDPDNECADQGAASCGTTGVCGGQNACAKYAVNTECEAAKCSNGNALSARKCDGAGTCQAATSTACGAYACVNASCNATCSVDGDCSSGNWCDQSGDPDVCKAKLDAGAPCTDDKQCKNGVCLPPDADAGVDGGASVCN